MISLFKIPITIERDDGVGGYDAEGRWNDGTVSPFDTKGSIQPFRSGNTQIVLPEGVRAEDALIIYTKDPTIVTNQFDKVQADKTTIDGRVYEAFMSENWNRHGLTPDHFKTIFIREDLITNGKL